MPATHAPHLHARQYRSRLGRLGDIDHTQAAKPAAQVVSMFRHPTHRPRFPAGVVTRRVDHAGRIKVAWTDHGTFSAANALGWRPGPTQVIVIDRWAVITQPADVATATPRRASAHAVFNIDNGGERLGLRTAHRHALGNPDTVLVAPIPHIGGLVIAPIDVCLDAGPPNHIVAVLTTPTS